MGYRVIAPLVYLKVPDAAGKYVNATFYAGAPVPDGVDEKSLQHHLDNGQVVEEDDPAADILAVPAGTPIPGEPPNVEPAESKTLGEKVEEVRKTATTRTRAPRK